ncbi:MAG TPA: NUDIX domain-containing protein [Bacteroidales bacterium]|jgi:ADP-ribose pyrophosphatase YjhB (NUDIX family)|nr:NUDIX domain-containing protein [Bacteroidales bacterium]HPB35658.1 NUDIX domain-containing protein [Bacteroidales bacterium]HPL06631.1 NUDIX domain-containing protein [Bacteroidales bacterium]
MKQHPLGLFAFCPVCGSGRFVENNFKSKRCMDCGFVYYLNIAAAVAAFILNPAGELLLCRRAKEPALGSLDLPGGFVDMGENIEEALRREIYEELSLKVDTTRYLFSLPNIYKYSGMEIHTLDFFFLCLVSEFDSIQANDDVGEAFFRPLNKIYPADFGLDSIKKGIIAFLNETPQIR